MESLERPREADAGQVIEPDGAGRLAGLAGTLRGQRLTADIVGGRLRVADGPDGEGVVLDCRRRASDGDQWWFTWADGIWLCEADHPMDAVVAVKGALRRPPPP
ncbi:hypothetical protein AGRA3207_004461 [Actinomadura graeca]|uniref:Uncharacterized protein n=1 Tax=Actinomadura graeca TaxID=2750812 RepID=A0ABX8QWT6_9ACTN|nr:hypothetical protein [Actinomadura graeca]QXJ23320.1 hypothetical protein AGRA3207_004461 [Actinomadura graeca]